MPTGKNWLNFIWVTLGFMAYTVCVYYLSSWRYVNSPNDSYWLALKCVLTYLKDTMDRFIRYSCTGHDAMINFGHKIEFRPYFSTEQVGFKETRWNR